MTIRMFGRLRVGNAEPLVSSLKVGELVASRQGTLYLGIGDASGSAATSVVSFSGTGPTMQSQEIGGLIYSDETANAGTQIVMLSAPTTLTLTSMTHRTGSGSCSLQLRSGSTTYQPTATATTAITRTEITGTSLQRRVQQGQPIELVVGSTSNLTSLIVQLDWLEG